MPGFIDTPLLDQVSADSNEPARSRLSASGFEISPVEDVARAAWDAVHGISVHTPVGKMARRSEEHTSELQSLMRNSYAVFCLKKKIKRENTPIQNKQTRCNTVPRTNISNQ